MRIHELKTDPIPFLAVYDGRKLCEVRNNDRDFQVGDLLLLHRLINPVSVTGKTNYDHQVEPVLCQVTHVQPLDDYVGTPNMVALSIKVVRLGC